MIETTVDGAGRIVPERFAGWPMICLSVGGLLVACVAVRTAISWPHVAGSGVPGRQPGLIGVLAGLVPGIAGLLVGRRQSQRVPVPHHAELLPFPGHFGPGQPVLGPTGFGPGGNSRTLLMRLGQNRFYCDALLFLFVALPVRGAAQLVRFADWYVVDGLTSGIPVGLVEAATPMLEPIQKRSVAFYIVSAVVGTAILTGLIVWLRR